MTTDEKIALYEFIETANFNYLVPVMHDTEKLKLVLSALKKINTFLDLQKVYEDRTHEN